MTHLRRRRDWRQTGKDFRGDTEGAVHYVRTGRGSDTGQARNRFRVQKARNRMMQQCPEPTPLKLTQGPQLFVRLSQTKMPREGCTGTKTTIKKKWTLRPSTGLCNCLHQESEANFKTSILHAKSAMNFSEKIHTLYVKSKAVG